MPTLASIWVHPRFLVGLVLFLCCPILFTFWVPCCDVRYDFRIKTMFGSSLTAVICRRVHVLFTLFVFVCVQWCLTHIVLCSNFVCLRLVYPMLPVSLCCVVFVFVLCTLMLSVSLECPFVIVPSVFSNVYFKLDFDVFVKQAKFAYQAKI